MGLAVAMLRVTMCTCTCICVFPELSLLPKHYTPPFGLPQHYPYMEESFLFRLVNVSKISSLYTSPYVHLYIIISHLKYLYSDLPSEVIATCRTPLQTLEGSCVYKCPAILFALSLVCSVESVSVSYLITLASWCRWFKPTTMLQGPGDCPPMTTSVAAHILPLSV